MLIWHCLQYKAIKKSTNRGNHVSKQHSAAFILLLFFRFLDLDSFRESFIFFQTWHRTLGPKSNCSSYLHLQFAIYWQVLYTGSLALADFSGAVFTHAYFQKIAQIYSLCNFHHISEGIPSLMHFWLLMT